MGVRDMNRTDTLDMEREREREGEGEGERGV